MTTLTEVRQQYPQYGDMSDEQLGKALHKKFYSDIPYADFASRVGLASDKSIPGESPAVPKQTQQEAGFLQKRVGELEAMTSLATGATTGMVGRAAGTMAGILGSVRSGTFGTQEGAAEAGQFAEKVGNAVTFEPKTQVGKDIIESIGRLFDSSKLAGLGPSGPTAVASADLRGAGQVASGIRQEARDLRARGAPAETQMAGMGSANTAQEAMRLQRASDLPAPIDLTKGQATRDFAQQQFEREAAKSPDVGGPLRQRFSEQNQQILKNFDAWVDQTGAEAGSLRAVGQTVTDAVVGKSLRAKAEIKAAYTKAKESGDMQEKIDISPLKTYLEEHQAEAINAPVLTSVSVRVGDSAEATINHLEEIRKMVGRLGQKDPTNGIYATEVKQVIDGMTEGVGGELYKRARALRHRYGQEFEDHAIIDKMLSYKPGTKDRAVAYEDVFDHSILKGSLDDVRLVRKTLQTSGKEGEQAWRELQGATIMHLKDEITKSVQLDQQGNRVLSPARLDRLVNELDKDGKLDFIFGKQGAQQIRDVNGIAQDVLTSPVGAVNHSNTASILTIALDKIAGAVTGIPFVGSAANFAKNEVKNAADRRRVQQALKK